jgi:hypothetical protein
VLSAQAVLAYFDSVIDPDGGTVTSITCTVAAAAAVLEEEEEEGEDCRKATATFSAAVPCSGHPGRSSRSCMGRPARRS